MTPTGDRSHQPLVGVSACLIGNDVRYDGLSKKHPIIEFDVAPWLNMQAFCPEMAAGFGAPRPPVNLHRNGAEITALTLDGRSSISGGRNFTDVDIADTITHSAQQALDIWGSQLCAYIVKARSPSCAAGTAPLYNSHGEITNLTDGLLVSQLRSRYPGLMIVDEAYFDSRDCARQFVEACYALWQQPLGATQ